MTRLEPNRINDRLLACLRSCKADQPSLKIMSEGGLLNGDGTADACSRESAP